MINKINVLSSGRRTAGFTLIEVMIVVVIVAILASIAYPSYQRYVQQTRRADAQTALMELAHFMERYYTSRGGYLDNGRTGNKPSLPFDQSPKDGKTAMYKLSLKTADADSYTLQAEPKGSMEGDTCGTLTLDNLGRKGNKSSQTVDQCWRR